MPETAQSLSHNPAAQGGINLAAGYFFQEQGSSIAYNPVKNCTPFSQGEKRLAHSSSDRTPLTGGED